MVFLSVGPFKFSVIDSFVFTGFSVLSSTRYRLMNSVVLNNFLKSLCIIKKWDFWYPVQLFTGLGLVTLENQDIWQHYSFFSNPRIKWSIKSWPVQKISRKFQQFNLSPLLELKLPFLSFLVIKNLTRDKTET